MGVIALGVRIPFALLILENFSGKILDWWDCLSKCYGDGGGESELYKKSYSTTLYCTLG